MLTDAGGRVLATLLGEALDRGEVQLEGARLVKDGRPVMPKLAYLADTREGTAQRQRGEPQQRAPGAGIRLGAARDEERDTMTSTLKYAPLPAELLVATDPEVQKRQIRSQRAALEAKRARQEALARIAWPREGFAPLPRDPLVDK